MYQCSFGKKSAFSYSSLCIHVRRHIVPHGRTDDHLWFVCMQRSIRNTEKSDWLPSDIKLATIFSFQMSIIELAL